MTVTEQQIRHAIAEQAAEWFVASRTGPLDEQGRADFMAWLRTCCSVTVIVLPQPRHAAPAMGERMRQILLHRVRGDP